mmetsp:Transcript_41266/g.109254  ORF Transcript_41266/g.109254 Transcript_41266/m.109254 type:complete len:223 (-) Transcript_41266:297-965(-)
MEEIQFLMTPAHPSLTLLGEITSRCQCHRGPYDRGRHHRKCSLRGDLSTPPILVRAPVHHLAWGLRLSHRVVTLIGCGIPQPHARRIRHQRWSRTQTPTLQHRLPSPRSILTRTTGTTSCSRKSSVLRSLLTKKSLTTKSSLRTLPMRPRLSQLRVLFTHLRHSLSNITVHNRWSRRRPLCQENCRMVSGSERATQQRGSNRIGKTVSGGWLHPWTIKGWTR